MKILQRVVSVAAIWATALFARAGDPVSVKDVDRSPVGDLHLDITQVDLFRLEDRRMVFKASFAAPPDLERWRILIDVDGPDRGEPDTGADYMLEGNSFYRYPKGATDWTWDAIEPPFIWSEGRTIVCVLPKLQDLPLVTEGRWIVETTTSDWKTADRLPKDGALKFDFSKLPVLPFEPRINPEDLSEFMAGAAASLCLRADSELKSRPWKSCSSQEHPMTWTPVFSSNSLPLRVVLSDMVAQESTNLYPEKTFTAGDAVEWTGKSLGINWVMMMEPMSNGDLRLMGQLMASSERCVRIGIGCEVNIRDWIWHDDFRFHRPMVGSNQYANVIACPFGSRGDRSLYPFGVISSEKGSLIVETDLNEPRIFQIVADARDSFFGVFYDFGITPLTSNFPSRVAFCCTLRSSEARGEDAFRRALESWYAEQPDLLNRQVPEVGAWLPFTNPGTISNLQDFGFAFLERLPNEVADASASRDLLNFGYLEPWLYWLPVPADVERTEEEVLRRMKVLAGGGDRRAELAMSALLGAERRIDGLIDMQFMDRPWCSGARMEINTDPELATTSNLPVNRAMTEWREAKRMLRDKSLSGVYLDSMAEPRSADYNPAAMAVADYPCTFERDVLKPCLPMEWSEFEYVAAMSRAMRARGKYVMGNFACADSPFFMKYIDVPGEELEKLDPNSAHFRRAMSGHKPFVTLWNTPFDKRSSMDVVRFFKECLALGFLPGFFSQDGFHQPYWEDAAWYARDRPAFKLYMPLVRRLAMGGWQPVGFARSSVSNLWVESFGDVAPDLKHMTLRNVDRSPVTADLELTPLAQLSVVMDPLSAECLVLESNQTQCPVMVSGDDVELRDLIPVSALDSEAAFMRSWNSGGREAEACAKVLESIRQELNLGALCNISYAAPAVLNRTNVFNLVIQNRGSRTIEVADLKVITTKQFRPFEIELKTAAPGGSLMVNGYYSSADMGRDSWLEVQWTLRCGDREMVCTRMINPRYSPEDLKLFRSRVRR